MTESPITFEPKNIDDLSSFLRAKKDEYHEIWVVLTKKEIANPQPVSFNEAVSKAIELGLVDSRTKTLNKKKYAVRFTKGKSEKI